MSVVLPLKPGQRATASARKIKDPVYTRRECQVCTCADYLADK